jgi:outer membrane protein assembly factor BamD (BamD/ComL family)
MTSSSSTTATPPAASPFDGDTPFLTPKRIRLLAIVGGVVVVVALATWFLMTAGKRKEAFAARALESARAVAETGDMGTAVQQFEQVATTYAGTDAGYEAVLGIAQARLVAGQAELAISSLEEFIASNPPERFRGPANSLMATALENTGKYAEAAAAYRRASDLETVEYLKATLLLDSGRAAREAGDTAAATAAYQEVLDKYGETAARSEAEVRLAELSATPA